VASGEPFYEDAEGTDQYEYYTCQDIIKAAKADAGGEMEFHSALLVACPLGYYKVTLHIAPFNGFRKDYHWYRQDRNGCWSHKPALGEATQNEWPGQTGSLISDPRESSKIHPTSNPPLHYSEFCGFFCVRARENGIPTEAARQTGG
jgi:hypothetical protein